MKSLEMLNLTETKVTAAGIARLKKWLPRCDPMFFPPEPEDESHD